MGNHEIDWLSYSKADAAGMTNLNSLKATLSRSHRVRESKAKAISTSLVRLLLGMVQKMVR